MAPSPKCPKVISDRLQLTRNEENRSGTWMDESVNTKTSHRWHKGKLARWPQKGDLMNWMTRWNRSLEEGEKIWSKKYKNKKTGEVLYCVVSAHIFYRGKKMRMKWIVECIFSWHCLVCIVWVITPADFQLLKCGIKQFPLLLGVFIWEMTNLEIPKYITVLYFCTHRNWKSVSWHIKKNKKLFVQSRIHRVSFICDIFGVIQII